MKTNLKTLEHSISYGQFQTLTMEEQRSINGGNFIADCFETLGYMVGYAVGFFLVDGPSLIMQALLLLRYLI